MRERLQTQLGNNIFYDKFLVYVMGPYKNFDLEEMLPENVDPAELSVSFVQWEASEGDYTEQEVLTLLRTVRDGLRATPGVNAFLAIDVGIDLDEMDAATQSIEFARASNVTVFVIPQVGKILVLGLRPAQSSNRSGPRTELLTECSSFTNTRSEAR